MGLLDEVRESRDITQDRVWDLFHAHAIRVRRRVEMSVVYPVWMGTLTMPSVYVGELKFVTSCDFPILGRNLKSVYMRVPSQSKNAPSKDRAIS